tara:strand:- start:876 stop:1097 length:222 start_codon:yes stop_codon:yes gene_type:complete
MNTNITLQLAKGINKNPAKNKKDLPNKNILEEVEDHSEDVTHLFESDLSERDSYTWLSTDNWLKYYNFSPKFI